MFTYNLSPDHPKGEVLRNKNSTYSSDCTTPSSKTALQELWEWINSEDFSRCPICNEPFKYPGLDAAKCATHGYQESRRTKLEQLCRTPLKLGASKKKAIKPSELTEEQARTALFILRGGAA